jgi:DNA-damage-inducible protein J
MICSEAACIANEIHSERSYGERIVAAQTSMLHVRIDDRLKTEATARLADVGLTVSDAVRILLTRVAKEGGLPAGLATDPEAHDAWFRAKVQEAMRDTRPPLTHQQVMGEAQEAINRKRRARN